MKEKLKKIPIIAFLWKKIKPIKEMRDFNKDKKIFKKFYINKINTKEKIEYSLMLIIHQIEKAFTIENKRRFGIQKIKQIISLLELYETKYDCQSYYYDLALSCLENYKNLYKDNNWIDTEEYILVEKFLEMRKDNYNKMNVGAIEIDKNSIIEDSNIDYLKFLKSRHSIRSFSDEKLKESDIEKAVIMSSLSPTACNRQMCKIYYLKTDNSKETIKEFAQGLSLFELENANYFVVTFDISSFVMIGERNQGWLNAGLVSMNFVNALHSLGIGSCFCQFGNSFNEEKKLKNILKIPVNERIAVIIVAGYYPKKTSVPCSNRKKIGDIYFIK